ncbi:ATP-binding protein [Oleomonas cavernae]|uniref:ATP-binding protein n=1 Tax=Oleomonas cavernae TaxID=2320859 RepID=A0A418WTI8_9PROT|nr:terminase family protein [Oleomonas cavernae]RJF94584.1 ATP-binding protein [Oleomonas cavernae]
MTTAIPTASGDGSKAGWLASASPADRAAFLHGLSPAEARCLFHDWSFWSRPNQQSPPGDEWTGWLVLAGRGFGKTRAGAEWVRAAVEAGRARRIALVGATAADARQVMIEGESGLLAISPPWMRPLWEPSKRLLTWPNGAVATAFSAERPGQLRGPQHDLAWADELCKWRHEDAWEQMLLGLRLGAHPRWLATTTPRPSRLIRGLLADPKVHVTRGSTFDNWAHLAPTFLAEVVRRYQGTRLGRQELHAELVDDVPGALWTRALIEAGRVARAGELARVVVGVDPAVGAAGEGEGAETGIIVAGRGIDGRAVVLADLSCRMAPTAWARRAIDALRRFEGDRLVAEVNQGGDLVESLVRTLAPEVPYRAVRAARGKAVRAEPIAALYEQGRVVHVPGLETLEDQMCRFTSHGPDGPSDRVDALVWALTDLMLGPVPPAPRLRRL